MSGSTQQATSSSQQVSSSSQQNVTGTQQQQNVTGTQHQQHSVHYDVEKGLVYSDKDKLDGSKNFIAWSFKIERQFRKDKCWREVVNPDHLNPVQLTTEQYEEKKERAIYIFSMAVKDHIIPIIKKFIDDPAKIWLQLKSRFESAAMGKQLILRERLAKVHMTEGGSVEEYVREIDVLVMQLADIDFTIEDKELMRTTLKGLPPSWKPFITSFGTLVHQFPSMTFSDLVGHLEAEEMQRELQGNDTEQVFMTAHNSFRGNPHSTFSRGRGRGRNFSRGRGRSSTFSNMKRNDTCNFCGNAGHCEGECLKKIETQIKGLQNKHADIKNGMHQANVAEAVEADEPDSPNSNTVEVNLSEFKSSHDWLIDSGASVHVTGNRDTLSKVVPYASSSNVITASGARIPVAGKGDTKIGGNKVVKKVLYVPGMTRNLLSVGQLTDEGYDIYFNSRHGYILDREDPTKVFLRATRDTNSSLYKLDTQREACSEIHFSSATTTRLVESKDSLLLLWHRRLSHVNLQRLCNMTAKGLVTGIPKLPYEKHICESCVMGKQHRERIPKKSNSRSTHPLQLVHSDLCGPFATTSILGAKYLLTFTDDFSRYTWVYFLKSKADTFAQFKIFKSMVENEFNTKLLCLRSDRGGEYLSTEFSLFCDSHGIKRQLTTARTPQQNGVAERKNRTLLEAARSMQAASGLPLYLWDELIRTANYVLNRCETSALASSTPFQQLYKVQPDLSHLRVVGCLTYVHIPAELCHKLAAKSIRAYLVGYDTTSKAYRCFEPIKRRIYITRDVIFNEELSLRSVSDSTSALDLPQPAENQISTPTQSTSISITTMPINVPSPNSHSLPSLDISTSPQSSEDNFQPSTDIPDSPNTPTDPATPVTPTSYSQPVDSPITSPTAEALPHRKLPLRTRALPVKLCHDYVLLISPSTPDICIVETTDTIDDNIPFEQARFHSGWMAAMREEIDSLQQHNTWTLTELPPGHRVLSARWVYRAKPEINPSRTRLKARLVARGIEQRSGIDFNDTFAPVVKWSTIRLIIALAAAHGWPITQMDVVTAFLNGTLKELVYMVQPPGFEVPGSEHLVCRLNRSIYGLKQSPRAWYEEINRFLISLGWSRSAADSNLYFINEEGKIALLLIFVDDLLLTGNATQKLPKSKHS